MLDFLVALGVAALSGMGVGSGGLLVVYLTEACHIAQVQAQGINLFFFLFSSSASTAVNIRRRNIPYGAVLLLSASGMISAVLGAFLASRISPDLLRRLFGGMLLAVGVPGVISGVRALKDGR